MDAGAINGHTFSSIPMFLGSQTLMQALTQMNAAWKQMFQYLS